MDDDLTNRFSERSQAIATKVQRVLREYELAGLGEELERRWLGVEGDRQSLRDLADYLNRRVLQAALEDAGEQPIDGEIKNHYRLLHNDDVSASARTQAETRLNRIGINVESLRRDFVSHQAVHTYLTDVREATLPGDEPSADDAIQSRLETILRLQNRLVAVTERSLESLRNADYISIGTFDVMVSVTVYCENCGASFDFVELAQQQVCECTEKVD